MNASLDERRDRGQVLAIFALALVAIVAMTGLVIDGGSTFVQRRDMQNVADAAAMAAAYDYANSRSAISATAAAKSVAAANGYPEGVDGVIVNVAVNEGSGATTFDVSVGKPHRNSFSGIVGLTAWDVSTTATSITGPPNSAIGVGPLLFNRDAFDPNNTPNTETTWYSEPGTGTEDVPQGAEQFNWTVYCTASGNECNGDSNDVGELITGTNESGSVVTLGSTEIGPLNAGAHTDLYSDLVEAGLVGECFPVSIVEDDGTFVGLAMFCLTGSVGGETKAISGYFTTSFQGEVGWQMRIDVNSGPGTNIYGGYVAYLID